MMRVTIIAVGNLKDAYSKDAAAELLTRLSVYAKVNVIEVAEERFTETTDIAKVKAAEAEQILKKIPDRSIVIALDEHGKQHTSETFAQWIGAITQHGDALVFVIGGARGLAPEVLARAQHHVALSSLTFTHQMTRVILLEQLYRASTILHGKTYHY